MLSLKAVGPRVSIKNGIIDISLESTFQTFHLCIHVHASRTLSSNCIFYLFSIALFEINCFESRYRRQRGRVQSFFFVSGTSCLRPSGRVIFFISAQCCGGFVLLLKAAFHTDGKPWFARAVLTICTYSSRVCDNGGCVCGWCRQLPDTVSNMHGSIEIYLVELRRETSQESVALICNAAWAILIAFLHQGRMRS